ncbi:MAG: GNAT family N-acetyltransferase [Chloroflexota bacterium]|nr:GNAT family N-acetyltransferase [Chloroflexota bacterium]
MDSSFDNLVKLDKSCIKPAVDVLVKAFWNYPLFLHYFPNEQQRANIAPYFLSFSVFSGVSYGEVYATSPNLEGVAVWMPSKNYPLSFWRFLRSIPLSVSIGFGRHRGARLQAAGSFIDSVHKRLVPYNHWYLEVLGVEPLFQKQGFSSRLLRPMLARIDEEGLPCYLETLDEQDVSIYEHFGFKVIEKADIPRTGLTNWAMLREARKL